MTAIQWHLLHQKPLSGKEKTFTMPNIILLLHYNNNNEDKKKKKNKKKKLFEKGE